MDLRVDRQVRVQVSYIEIYNEVLYDLLSDDPLANSNLTVVDAVGSSTVCGMAINDPTYAWPQSAVLIL